MTTWTTSSSWDRLWNYHLNYGVIQRFPSQGKAVTTYIEKYDIISCVLLQQMNCWHFSCPWRHTVRLMSFLGLWLQKHWKICISDRQWHSNFARRGRKPTWERKTESYVFWNFGICISCGQERRSTGGKFATGQFWPSSRALWISSNTFCLMTS